jgi:hypothetical protein
LAHERGLAEVPHPGARRTYEEAETKSGQTNLAWVQPTADLLCVPYLTDNHYAVLQAGSKFRLVCRGRCGGRRLSRNRSLRLHGVLKMRASAMGLRLLTLTYGFCG